MTRRVVQIGANSPCPCFSGSKFKQCCRGKVNWPEILATPGDHIAHLSARGRNILFAEAIFDALQLNVEQEFDRAVYKGAFTADAVRKINEAIYQLWPPDTDLPSVFSKSRESVVGLYVGDYQGRYLEQAIIRHSLYADKIYLVDPFLHPHTLRPEFNPIERPDRHRGQTLQNVNQFLRILPWIDAGLVEFIRTPSDFDRRLNSEALKRATELKEAEEVSASLKDTASLLMSRHREQDFQTLAFLATPNETLVKKLREIDPEVSQDQEELFIRYIEQQRLDDPDFLATADSFPEGQFFSKTSGGTIEVAALTANMGRAYLFTDLAVRWDLIELEKKRLGAESRNWSPFAKAVDQATFSFLNAVDLDVALRLRRENRLAGVRRVLRDAWKTDLSDDEFDPLNAVRLSENLVGAIDEAQAEWEEIDAELRKWSVLEATAATLASGPLIAGGQALWAAGASSLALAGNWWHRQAKYESYQKRFPASFFMEVGTS